MDSTLTALLLAGGTGALISRIQSPVQGALRRKLTGSVMVEGMAYRATSLAVAKAVTDSALVYGDGDGFDRPAYPGNDEPPKNGSARLAPGTRVAKIDGKQLVIDISREKMMNSFYETATITTTRKNLPWLKAFVEKAIDDYRLDMARGLPVFSATTGGYWNLATIRPFRSITTIEHPNNAPAEVLQRIREWEATESICVERGENFHIGFLLEGPPGTGKTSTAIAIASELKRPLYVLLPKVAEKANIEELIGGVPPHAILLVEECEQVFKRRGEDKERDAQVASALSYFDGPLSKHGLIRIYTTNHPDHLDESFTRVGRCDYQIHFPERGLMALKESA